MKLNATAEMVPITWPKLNRIHPFAPLDQARGYAELIGSLEDMLCEVTGFPGMSLQVQHPQALSPRPLPSSVALPPSEF